MASFAASPLGNGGDFEYEESEEATHIPAMIQVDDEDLEKAISELESEGVIVLRHRGNILLTYIPVDSKFLQGEDDPEDSDDDPEDPGEDPEDPDDNPVEPGEGDDEAPISRIRKNVRIGNIHISKARTNEPTMKIARMFNDAYKINEGGEISPYTGKGVVVGVCDTGMDTRHPNFLTADGSECRIRKVVQYEEQKGLRTVYETPEDIYKWETDTPDDWHATHVTGIAAGAHKESGYYSLAYDADIVFTASQLSDVGLLAGVEDIIEYAKSVNKPAVVNISMGNYVGPHDGTSLFTQYLDKCAEDAVICISAGNEGSGKVGPDDYSISTSYDFIESKREYRIIPCDFSAEDVAADTEVWSADGTPFTFAFYLNCNSGYSGRKDIFEDLQFPVDGTIGEWRISSDKEDPDYDPNLAEYFYEGYVKVTGGISHLNGRYYVSMEYALKSDIYHFDNKSQSYSPWIEYWPAIKMIGEPGTHIDIYTYGSGVRLLQERGFEAPNNSQCISDLATGHRTISVGMMNSTEVNGDDEGEISMYSSYGTLIDGRKLPMTVAPGAYIISSMSTPFLEKDPDYIQWTDDSSDYNGKTVYWIGTLGTSMSCPFVVSAIATWLEAFPELNSEAVIDIIQKTNQKSGYPNPSNPRHGQGWFNPYTGLQEVVRQAIETKIEAVDYPEATIRIKGRELLIGNISGTPVALEIYNPSGMLVDRAVISEALGTYSLNHLPAGIYLIRGGNQTLKVVI